MGEAVNMKTEADAISEKYPELASDLLGILEKHAPDASAEEALVLCAYMTGVTLALQDIKNQPRVTFVQMIKDNIEAGNRWAIEMTMQHNGR